MNPGAAVPGGSGAAPPRAPARLVSLCPSLSESVVALGLGAQLVGRTKFCVYPAAELAGVEPLGGTKDPRLERLLALAPDLVLMNAEENRREDHAWLLERGVACHASFPKSPADAAALLRELGALLGAEAAAEPLASAIEAKLTELDQRRAADAAPRGFLGLIWRRPGMAFGPDSYASRLLEAAGGRNVLAAAEPRYPALEADQIRALDPERVLLLSEPFPFAAKHRQELEQATGLPAERFRFADGRLLTWHGPSTARALEHALDLLGSPAIGRSAVAPELR
jgi:ABC-type Fe3+-hydroxamate transport system substrate-binding protein